MKKISNMQTNGIVIKEAIPKQFELMEYIGTDEDGEAIRVYVYRIEKINKPKK